MSDTTARKLTAHLTEDDLADPRIADAIKIGEAFGMVTAAKRVENTLNANLTMKKYDPQLYARMNAAISSGTDGLNAIEKTLYATAATLFEVATKNAKVDGLTAYCFAAMVHQINDEMRPDVTGAAAQAEEALAMRDQMIADGTGKDEAPHESSGNEPTTDEEVAKFFASIKFNPKSN